MSTTPQYTIKDWIQVQDNVAACKGPVLIITPPVFAHRVIEAKLLKLFPKKSRVVAASDIKPGNTEIPGDAIVICHGEVSDMLASRVPDGRKSKPAMCFDLATVIQYIQVMEQHLGKTVDKVVSIPRNADGSGPL